jgi:hypothetical protein
MKQVDTLSSYPISTLPGIGISLPSLDLELFGQCTSLSTGLTSNSGRIGPGYLFSDSLSNFNWITWINPNSKVLALVTGGTNGLGLNPFPTLDWNRIGTDVSPQVSKVDISLSLLHGLRMSTVFSGHWLLDF